MQAACLGLQACWAKLIAHVVAPTTKTPFQQAASARRRKACPGLGVRVGVRVRVRVQVGVRVRVRVRTGIEGRVRVRVRVRVGARVRARVGVGVGVGVGARVGVRVRVMGLDRPYDPRVSAMAPQ